MKLTDLLSVERIRIPLESTDKDGILREMVELLGESAPTSARVYEAVVEREKVMSTGIGRGVAIPHGKTDAVTGIHAAFGVTAVPVPFDAIDGEPVRICFLIVSEPQTTGPHIRILAQISNLLNREDCKEELISATTAEEVAAVFERAQSS